MKHTIFLTLIAALSIGCSAPATPTDSGRPDTSAPNDATPAPDASADSATPSDGATPSDVPAPMDVQSPTDGAALPDAAPPADATAPIDATAPMDVAEDRAAPPNDSGLFCRLPLGGTCPAGTTCPAGDGCNRCACPDTGGTAACTRIACPPDAGAGACRTAADCRLFESYCATAPCACLALSSGEPDPRCAGPMVTCFVPPCRGRTVDCVGGRCVAM
jgi:hypothetical protein